VVRRAYLVGVGVLGGTIAVRRLSVTRSR